MPSQFLPLLRNEIVKAAHRKLPWFGLFMEGLLCVIVYFIAGRISNAPAANAWGYVGFSMQLLFSDIGPIFVIVFSAMLMAGLDGEENKIDPGAPLDKDIYDLGPEEMKIVPSMPGSLEESLRALEKDHDFLLKGDVFSEELIETWIDYKMKNEVQAINTRPHPYEFALYYDI